MNKYKMIGRYLQNLDYLQPLIDNQMSHRRQRHLKLPNAFCMREDIPSDARPPGEI